MRSLGRAGIADLIERNCSHARRFAEGLQTAGYRVLNQVVLNQVLVAFGDAETTRRVIAAIQSEGTCWCGGTVWQGTAAMRISVSSAATTEADVERAARKARPAARERPGSGPAHIHGRYHQGQSPGQIPYLGGPAPLRASYDFSQ